jgi:hypothetical protein
VPSTVDELVAPLVEAEHATRIVAIPWNED